MPYCGHQRSLTPPSADAGRVLAVRRPCAGRALLTVCWPCAGRADSGCVFCRSQMTDWQPQTVIEWLELVWAVYDDMPPEALPKMRGAFATARVNGGKLRALAEPAFAAHAQSGARQWRCTVAAAAAVVVAV